MHQNAQSRYLLKSAVRSKDQFGHRKEEGRLRRDGTISLIGVDKRAVLIAEVDEATGRVLMMSNRYDRTRNMKMIDELRR
jgi:hypothetical protein